jgi:glycosyltransferase involved in cell wall biosynthesis
VAPKSQHPRVSVIVPARDSEAHLQTLLDALQGQTLPTSEFELVLADDGSTHPIDAMWSDQRPWVRVTRGPRLNSYAARNRAVGIARSDVLAFCDADCVPEPDWLAKGLDALDSSDLVAGRVRFILPSRRTVWTLLDMDSSKDQEREVRNNTAETANLFMRKELFERVGGFEDSIPEFGDFDFVQRAVDHGASLSFVSDVVVYHPTRDTASRFLRAQWIYSRGYASHESRARRLPQELALKSLVPVVPVMLSRRWWGRSYGPDRRWLDENGVVATPTEILKALPLMYIVVPYLRIAAQFVGWLDGRQLRE